MTKQATWIWYPGDFELALFNKTMMKRYERDVPVAPFWRMDSYYQNVKFLKRVCLTQTNRLRIRAEGLLAVQVNGSYQYGFNGTLTLEAGEYDLCFSVYNDRELPCLFVEGEEVATDCSWTATCNDHEDKAAGCGEFFDPEYSPNRFALSIRPVEPVEIIERDGKRIYDFGREMMAYVRLTGVSGKGTVRIYYGESLEEALDEDACELSDTLEAAAGEAELTTRIAKAFRYVNIGGEVSFTGVTALFEYLPIESKSAFACSDERLNRIYEVALETLHLNTREFFLDGIKRDRWVWGGDAYQSYLMNFYSFFDLDTAKRTMLALVGKEPYRTHINHIMDYTFYWIMGVYEYYRYTGDAEFLRCIYDKVRGMLEFCIGRTNENGLMEGYPRDWVFIDWADIDNTGEVCFEQMLYLISLRQSAELAELLGDGENAARWRKLAEGVDAQLEKFWDGERSAYVHSCKDGVQSEKITRYANMFALLYDLCSPERKAVITKNVLLNDGVQKITTPYMRFYELAALCESGEYDVVLQEMLDYWGGMLDKGATSFWEVYNPDDCGAEMYAMYGRPFGKSLCHAWGASPLYLLGRYFAGCRPIGDGTYEVAPQLSKLEWFRMTVPTAGGQIEIEMNRRTLHVRCEGVACLVRAGGRSYRLEAGKELTVDSVGSAHKES